MARHVNFNKELDQVLFEGESAIKKVILNRPKKLNILNHEMVSQMLRNFRAFEHDSAIGLVILKANGKAFCAGGDVVRAIETMTAGHWNFGALFYVKQYNLDYLLGTFKKPLVVLMDGVVMGGGAGISMNAKFKIVTENTVFAMPETSIGLFPDVGASYFLSRLPGFFGEYLGLTGARLNGSEMLDCGLATHMIGSKDLPKLEIALQAIGSIGMTAINEAINQFAIKPLIKDDSPLNDFNTITKSFSKDSVEGILASIEDEAKTHQVKRWIPLAIASMKSASPISLKIFLRSIREGRRQNLRDCLIREYTICCNIFRASASKDFYEGSTAMLLDKDKKPKWEPAMLELVSEDMVDICFNGIDDDDWSYLQLPVRPTVVVLFKPKL